MSPYGEPPMGFENNRGSACPPGCRREVRKTASVDDNRQAAIPAQGRPKVSPHGSGCRRLPCKSMAETLPTPAA